MFRNVQAGKLYGTEQTAGCYHVFAAGHLAGTERRPLTLLRLSLVNGVSISRPDFSTW